MEETIVMPCCECQKPQEVSKQLYDMLLAMAQGIFPEVPAPEIERMAKITYVCTPCRTKVN